MKATRSFHRCGRTVNDFVPFWEYLKYHPDIDMSGLFDPKKSFENVRFIQSKAVKTTWRERISDLIHFRIPRFVKYEIIK